MILDLHVQPGAKRSEFAGKHGGRMKLRLAAPAVEGKANDALIEFLADYFRVPQRNVRIVVGAQIARRSAWSSRASEWTTTRRA